MPLKTGGGHSLTTLNSLEIEAGKEKKSSTEFKNKLFFQADQRGMAFCVWAIGEARNAQSAIIINIITIITIIIIIFSRSTATTTTIQI